jgi:phosphohistidine phosphatase
MKLFFLRHGLAEDRHPDKTDADRALTPDGIQKMNKTLETFRTIGLQVDLVYSSPLLRARQTAEIVSSGLDVPMHLHHHLSPGFDHRRLQVIVQEANVNALMVVGHEPDFSETISSVIGGGQVVMKKGGLARVDILTMTPLSGELVWLLAPRTMV